MELWTDIRQKTYISAYQDGQSKMKGFVVAVKNTGVINTYYLEGIRRLDLARKGVDMESFEHKNFPSFERASLDELLLMNKAADGNKGER
jgi:hypothetical protein